VHNEVNWSGDSSKLSIFGQCLTKSPIYSINFKLCNFSPTCLQICNCKMYYVVHKFSNLSKTAIHLGTHSHLVAKGMCREYVQEMENTVAYEVYCTLTTTFQLLFCLQVRLFFFVTCSMGMDKVLWSSSKVNKIESKVVKVHS
jgi:hypothetical protein